MKSAGSHVRFPVLHPGHIISEANHRQQRETHNTPFTLMSTGLQAGVMGGQTLAMMERYVHLLPTSVNRTVIVHLLRHILSKAQQLYTVRVWPTMRQALCRAPRPVQVNQTMVKLLPSPAGMLSHWPMKSRAALFPIVLTEHKGCAVPHRPD